MPQNVASHLGLYCLLTVVSLPNGIELDIHIHDFPKTDNGLTQMIRMGKSILHIRVKKVGLYCLCSAIRDTDQLRGLPFFFFHIFFHI